MRQSWIGLIVVALAPLTLCGQVSPKAVRNASEIQPLLASISTYEFGQSRVPQAEFTQLVQDSLTNAALLKEIESSLLAFVQSNATSAAKQFAFRELSLVGTDTSVPVLAPMMLQPSTTEMARFALARIPGDTAGQALRDSLGKSTGSIRIGIIGSLAQRRDSKATPALVQLTSSSDQPTAEAALAALAEIADRPSLTALSQFHSKANGNMERRAAEAYLNCADQFAARGDKQAALGVYKQLVAPKEPPMVRVAAMSGMARVNPKEALPVLAPALESNDARVQFAAIRFLGEMPGSDAAAELQRAFPRLGAAGKVRLLGVLSEHGDASSRSLFTSAAQDQSSEVRAAALSGLGVLGDSSSISVLADAAARGGEAERNAARQSLTRLRGSSTDVALVTAIRSSNGKVKAELLLAAADRGTTDAADAAFEAIRDSDPDVRREALHAMKNLAGARQIPALVNLVTTASNATERKDAGQALGLVVQRSGDADIAPVLAAYKKSQADPPVRIALMEALSRTTNADALAELRDALHDPSPEIVRASILALTDWQTPAPMPNLLVLAKTQTSPALQILALRGYMKLAGLPSDRPNAESAKLLVPAAELAKEPAEKRALLAVLANYPCKESLDIVQSMAGDAAVAAEAKTAATRMQAAMRGAPGGRPR
jgi:HEAT repeat protein